MGAGIGELKADIIHPERVGHFAHGALHVAKPERGIDPHHVHFLHGQSDPGRVGIGESRAPQGERPADKAIHAHQAIAVATHLTVHAREVVGQRAVAFRTLERIGERPRQTGREGELTNGGGVHHNVRTEPTGALCRGGAGFAKRALPVPIVVPVVHQRQIRTGHVQRLHHDATIEQITRIVGHADGTATQQRGAVGAPDIERVDGDVGEQGATHLAHVQFARNGGGDHGHGHAQNRGPPTVGLREHGHTAHQQRQP